MERHSGRLRPHYIRRLLKARRNETSNFHWLKIRLATMQNRRSSRPFRCTLKERSLPTVPRPHVQTCEEVRSRSIKVIIAGARQPICQECILLLNNPSSHWCACQPALSGVDSLYSIAPDAGVPAATMAIGEAGATALLPSVLS